MPATKRYFIFQYYAYYRNKKNQYEKEFNNNKIIITLKVCEIFIDSFAGVLVRQYLFIRLISSMIIPKVLVVCHQYLFDFFKDFY